MRLEGPDSGTREFLRRQRMKARVRAFVLFARRQLTKFTSAESCRVLDMDFLEDGMFVA